MGQANGKCAADDKTSYLNAQSEFSPETFTLFANKYMIPKTVDTKEFMIVWLQGYLKQFKKNKSLKKLEKMPCADYDVTNASFITLKQACVVKSLDALILKVKIQDVEKQLVYLIQDGKYYSLTDTKVSTSVSVAESDPKKSWWDD